MASSVRTKTVPEPAKTEPWRDQAEPSCGSILNWRVRGLQTTRDFWEEFFTWAVLEFRKGGRAAQRYSSPSEEVIGWREENGRKERENLSHCFNAGSKAWRLGKGEMWRSDGLRARREREVDWVDRRSRNDGEERAEERALQTHLQAAI